MSFFAILIILFSVSPGALAGDLAGKLGTDAMIEAIPDDTAELLPEMSPTKLPGKVFFQTLSERILERLLEASEPLFRTVGIMLVVCLMIALSRSMEIRGNESEYIVFAGVAAIGAVTIGDLDSYLQIGTRSLENMCAYGRVVLPVLASAAAASGSAAGAAAKYESTAVVMDLLLSVCRCVALPCAGGYGALSLADAAVGNDMLRAAKKLVKSACSVMIKTIALGFTAWLSLTNLAAGSADTLAAKMARTAVSSALPVVGRILSDAASTVAAAAGALRSSIGIFGIIAILGICLSGVIPLGVRYFFFKLSAAVCSCVADKRIGDLIGDLGTCFGMILALNGTGAFILFFSFYSLMRTVQ